MRSVISFRLAVILLAMSAMPAVGCSTDREQVLIGKWQGDRMSATFAAIKLKEESGASTEDATNAAKILAATFVDLRRDKSFTAGTRGSRQAVKLGRSAVTPGLATQQATSPKACLAPRHYPLGREAQRPAGRAR